MQMKTYAGGPLALSIGDQLVEVGVPLVNGYGGTEFGSPCLSWDKIPWTSTKPDPEWSWYRFADDGCTRFEAQGDGTYELIVVVSCIQLL